MNAIWENIKGLYSLLVGLSITGRYFMAPTVTVHYPRQVVEPEILKSYRGPLELVPNEEDPSQSRCISCQMCVRACPGHCLTVVKGSEGKAPKEWTYDFTLCCLCGSCEEVCPASALRFSHDVYLVAESRDDLKMDLLAKLKQRGQKKLEA